MADLTLTKTRLIAGVWEGELRGAGSEMPVLRAAHLDKDLEGLALVQGEAPDVWLVRLSLPAQIISDGVQTVIFYDENDAVLDSFTLLSGEAMAADIRSEISLLRSELDMLKKSFRRHCNES
ncbi:hypothetical protein [Yoonia sediminilitoris]|uniref:Uncharacterized protein n=1 Tax=Yoonia sediminilitoris TaxID=1286148 RepID=A0A2T6KIS3_9RHOB|nr:hypothetical protein [Yoonia sediminilitoris]PUB15561.1 hypothetical protein C8N45_104181 [Yoonia sediminilitoris]RCW96170.1 hypothetical protein DFP92_104180 [Yoonia sediminilitoris]